VSRVCVEMSDMFYTVSPPARSGWQAGPHRGIGGWFLWRLCAVPDDHCSRARRGGRCLATSISLSRRWRDREIKPNPSNVQPSSKLSSACLPVSFPRIRQLTPQHKLPPTQSIHPSTSAIPISTKIVPSHLSSPHLTSARSNHPTP
jgi:hypothetical protein